jgi:sugar lactone lactonase YvrE
VSTAGAVETVAQDLRDPQGLALDDRGYLYVAESSRHRVVRVPVARPRATGTGP